MRLRARSRAHEDGQALAEFAIVASILCLLVFGLIDCARAWNVQQATTDAAREAARRAAIASSPKADLATVQAVVNTALTNSHIATCTNCTTGTGLGGASGTLVTVSVAYPYTFTIMGPLMRMFGSYNGSITLRTSATMRNE
jgi:Flp pilus assembly protein TadG